MIYLYILPTNLYQSTKNLSFHNYVGSQEGKIVRFKGAH